MDGGGCVVGVGVQWVDGGGWEGQAGEMGDGLAGLGVEWEWEC